VRPEDIPDKFFFKIGEVARLTDLPAHVLRYWETEFPTLQPKKHGNGQRLYRRKDIELVLEIRDLLYGQKFTIAGPGRSSNADALTEPWAAPRRTIGNSSTTCSAMFGNCLKSCSETDSFPARKR
jgi:hypothetical protein